MIFGFFGRFITVLGGRLFQCLVPIICAVAFVRQKNLFASALCAWWAGENLLDLAPYIADARALQLALLGGHTGAEVEGHDWEYILTQLGWLHRDVARRRGAPPRPADDDRRAPLGGCRGRAQSSDAGAGSVGVMCMT